MSLEQTISHFFKPEIRNRGEEDFRKGLVFVSNSSDTQIQAIVKGMPPLRVSLVAESISSPVFMADCTCTPASKGMLCKHIWATLLLVESKYPDFLDSKTDIEKGAGKPRVTAAAATTKKPSSTYTPSAEALARQEEYKTKQADFKKQQYEKQKQWAKDKRQEKKNKSKEPAPRETHSAPVEEALAFFSLNGFPMEDAQNDELLKKAKKNLARIFHPDKGGSHDEAVTLNQHYETLIKFLAATKPKAN